MDNTKRLPSVLSICTGYGGIEINSSESYLNKRREYYEQNKEEIKRKRRERYIKDKEADNKRSSGYYKANKDRVREIDLKRLYGITLPEYYAIYEKQNGVCAICGSDNNGKTLDVDHCHETCLVRGLLCRSCNLLLGHSKNDSFILFLAL